MENTSVGYYTRLLCEMRSLADGKIIRYAGSVNPYRKGRALHYNQHNEIRSCKFEKRGTILHSMTNISSS